MTVKITSSDYYRNLANQITSAYGPQNNTPFGNINWSDYGITNALRGSTDSDITSNIKSLYGAINNSSWDDASLAHWLNAIKEGGRDAGDYSGLANTLSAARDQNNRYFDNGVFNQELARGDINRLFGEQLRRNATFGAGSDKDADYWVDELKRGQSIQDVIRGIQSGSEYKNQEITAEALGITGSRDSWTADEQALVDKYVLPGGITTTGFDSLGLTAGDPTWSGDITDQNTIANTLGINAANPTSTSDFDNLSIHTEQYNGNDIIAGLHNLDTSTADLISLPNNTVTGTGGDNTVTGGGGNDTITGGGGGGGGGLSQSDVNKMFEARMKELFSNNWTPYGYGWGGSNTGGVAINRSNASKMGGPYAGNKSSFGRQGYRLATTPQGSNSY